MQLVARLVVHATGPQQIEVVEFGLAWTQTRGAVVIHVAFVHCPTATTLATMAGFCVALIYGRH